MADGGRTIESKIFKKVEDFALTKLLDAICCCPAEMRIPHTRDVLLFGLTGEPVSISQLIGSDFVVYRRRRNGDL